MRPKEPLLALTERELPRWWLDLDDSDWDELTRRYFVHWFEHAAPSGALEFEVDLSDREQIAAVLAVGAEPGPRPYSGRGELDREMWSLLLGTDPTLIEVTRSGRLVLAVFDTWDGAVLFDEYMHLDEILQNGFKDWE
jgi:hypothetical protein